jgi:hypothetical protein
MFRCSMTRLHSNGLFAFSQVRCRCRVREGGGSFMLTYMFILNKLQILLPFKPEL